MLPVQGKGCSVRRGGCEGVEHRECRALRAAPAGDSRNAARMLKAGGRLVYSTCTFAPQENEMAVETFIAGHPEFTIEETPVYEGLSSGVREWGNGSAAGIENTVRIWPHRTRGEGHFIAVLRKDGADREHKRNYPSYFRDRKALKDYYDFCNQYLTEPNEWIEQETFILFGEQLYRIPGEMPRALTGSGLSGRAFTWAALRKTGSSHPTHWRWL